MNGWIERNEKIKLNINKMLKKLPSIFNEFYIDMEGDGKSYTTIENYLKCIHNFMLFVNNGNESEEFYKDVTPIIIKQYIISMAMKTNANGDLEKMSDDYQAAIWSTINTFFNFLYINNYIKENPMLKTKRPKLNTEHTVTYLTESEIKKVFKSIEENYSGNMLNRDKAIIGLALSTGLRVSALVNINIEDIDLEKNTIKVIEKRTKTRYIPFGDNTKRLIVSWMDDRKKYYGDVDTSALFLSQCKKRISTNGVRDLTKKYTKDINKHITPHKFRSSAATNMAASGLELSTIGEMLGHKSTNTTLRYVKVLDENRNRAVKALDNLI